MVAGKKYMAIVGAPSVGAAAQEIFSTSRRWQPVGELCGALNRCLKPSAFCLVTPTRSVVTVEVDAVLAARR